MNSGPDQDRGWWDPSHPASQPTPSKIPDQIPEPVEGPGYPAPDQPYERPQFAAPSYPSTDYATSGYTADPYSTGSHPQPGSTSPQQRPGRAGLIVLVVALAVVIGGATGFLAGRLGQTAGTPASPTSNPVAAPSSSEPSSAASAPDPVPPAKGGAADTERIAEAVLPSTVTIRVSSGGGTGLGSGFAIDDEGRVMTNSHVVASADGGGQIEVTLPDGNTSAAELLGRSPGYDLAVIQVEDADALRPVRIGNSDKAKVGAPAIAIGSPLGLGGTVTQGIISAVDRPVAVGSDSSPDGAAYLNALQTDAPINRGNSGGPLVNARAEVIGVNSAILTGSNSSDESGNIGIGFAIPINQADEIGKLLIRDGHATYPVINASVTTNDSGDGVTLSAVEPGGAADKAGLRVGDVVRAIDGDPVTESEDLIVAIRSHRPGDTVTLQIERGGNEREIPVELGSERG